MAGLLDTFFGTPDQTRALGLLGAGMMNGGFAKGAPMAMEYMAGADDRKLKRGLLEAQMEETRAQAEERRQKLELARRAEERQNALLFGSPAGGAGAPAVPAVAGSPSQGVGFTQPQQGGLIGMARSMGIPEQAIQADIAFNGGKGIAEMLYKRGVPDMQVSNGYAFDKNRMGPGFLPQMNVSNDGKSTMVRIGPDGLPVVEAPAGAYNTFAGYQNIQEGVRANHDPVTVTPAGQPPQMTTRGALVRNPQVQGMQVPPAQQAAMDRDRQGILQAELTKAQQQLQTALRTGDQSAAARAQADIASLNRELGGRGATVGMPLQSEEEKLRATEGVKADQERNKAVAGNAEKARDMQNYLSRAKVLLGLDPTASGIGAVMDKGASLVGISTKGAENASALEAISGWLVSNVPRMEGPQSNFDVQNYQTMAGRVGDRTLPIPQRMAALTEIERLQQKYAGINGGGESKPSVLNELPKMAPKGQRVRDTNTGEILQFNGISWVKVK